MGECVREMTFKEEYEILKREANKLFEREIDGCEPPKENCIVRRALRCIGKLEKEIELCKEYRELEEKLCVMFAGDCSLSDVVENLERQITEPDKDHPVNARILTYEDAEKWNEYRELEEQGRLLKLPCKIGDAVYFIKNNGNACFTCEHLDRNYHKFDWCKNETITENGQKYIINPQYHKTPLCSKQFYEIRKIYMQSVPHILDYKKEFGNTIFLSKKEAEAKLKEMETSTE